MTLLLVLAACRPSGPVTVTITSPADGAQVVAGDEVALSATVTDEKGRPADDPVSWFLDDVLVASGADASASLEDGGRHVLKAWTDRGEATQALYVRVPTDLPGVTVWGASEGIPDDVAWTDLDVAPDGTLYAATSAGLMVLGADDVPRFFGPDDGLAGVPRSVAAVGGEVWVGYDGVDGVQGERLIVGESAHVVGPIAFTRTGEIRSIFRILPIEDGDLAGDVWMGTNEGLTLYDAPTDSFLEHLHPTHPHGYTLGLARTAEGDVWNGDQYQLSRWWYDGSGSISTTGNLVAYDGLFGVDPGVPIGVRDVSAAGETVWVAADLGLVRVDATETGLGAIAKVDGFSSATAVATSPDGVVWVGTPSGPWTVDSQTNAATDRGAAWMPGPGVEQIRVDGSVAPAVTWIAAEHGLARIVGVAAK